MSLEAAAAKGEESMVSDAKIVALDLLDEYWFFGNAMITTNTRKILQKPPMPTTPPPDPSSTNKDQNVRCSTRQTAVAITADDPPLLRAPSLPPRIGQEATVPFKTSNAKFLRHSFSTLSSSSSSSSSSSKSLSTARQGPPRVGIKAEGSRQRYLMTREADRCARSFQERKWKSLSDLEHVEVQGFKDLGFVFDDKERLSASLVRIIPGLCDQEQTPGLAKVRSRPYLSEAWSAPPAIRLVGRQSSAEDMKEQLRFWARAVASNVRQEC